MALSLLCPGACAQVRHDECKIRSAEILVRAYSTLCAVISQPLRHADGALWDGLPIPSTRFRITAGVQVRAVGATETVWLQPPQVKISP